VPYQNIFTMKANIFLLLLLLPLFLPGQSDECARYDGMIKEAEQALRAEDYQTTLLRLNEAKILGCHKKKFGRADELIRKLFKTMKTKNRKAKLVMEKAKDDPARFAIRFAAYLASEAETAFLREDIRLAWLLTVEALEKDPDNEKAQHLKQELPGYGTDFFLEAADFYGLQSSPDSAYSSFFTKEADGSYTLNVLELGVGKAPEIFPNSYNSLYSGSYSPDSRYLAFYTNVADNIGTLNVLDLEGNEPLLTFPDSTNFYGAKYSPDSRYLVFFTKEADGSYTLNVLELGVGKAPEIFPNSYNSFYRYGYSPDSRFLVFFTNVADNVGTLNVLELGGNKSPLTFPNCGDYYDEEWYCYSPDGRYLVFFTNPVDSKGTLNLLKLGEDKPPLTFPNSFLSAYRFSSDSQYALFFSQGADQSRTLNVLGMEGNKPPRTFPNVFSCRFSPDSRYALFFTDKVDHNTCTLNVLELEGNKPSRTFPNFDYRDHGDFDDWEKFYTYRFSPDGRHLLFFTREADKSWTLNVLGLEGNSPPLTFPYSEPFAFEDEDRDNHLFSPDSRHLAFFTREAGGGQTWSEWAHKWEDGLFTERSDVSYTLNVLELGEHKPPLVFRNRGSSFQYSPDGRYLLFFTNNNGPQNGVLNVLELGGNTSPRMFPDSYRYHFSPDSRHLAFFTDVADWRKGDLNVLELGGNKSPLIFPNSYYYNCEFSPDGRRLAFLAGDRATTKILDLDSKKIAQQIKNQYLVGEGMTFLNKDNLLVISRNPVTQNDIYKIINLERIGEGYWDYLTKERYAPLTAEEKRAYGIME
jgi:Tol biopolymer transport system component